MIDRFADIRILRYMIPGWEELTARQRALLYHLSEAALWGRDIYWHQNAGEAGLEIRSAMERIYEGQRRRGELDVRVEEYMKRIWFANGVHHHYSNDKILPTFGEEEFDRWSAESGAQKISAEARRLMFDADYKAKKVSLDMRGDVVTESAVNFYGDGVGQRDVEEYYDMKGQATSEYQKRRHPLNSQLVRGEGGELEERVWTTHGMYGEFIRHITEHLREAQKVATGEAQREALGLLIEYYESGDLNTFDEYSKKWVADKGTEIDYINGFIEVYDDPMGLKGTWESIVELKDSEATKQIELIAANAQWFEDHSPVAMEHRKKQVSGVSMNVISAVMLGGDCYPSTPIGVNLPNADWIREQYGSKSISLSNITKAYADEAKSSGVLAEFAASDEEIARCRKYGSQSDDLHTQLHECLGHGSGQMNAGVTLDALKSYGSTIEEARADLFALYFMADPKMLELGIIDTLEAAWAHYDAYLRGGIIVQLSRIEEGRDIEEAHMRNRALIARWALEKAAAEGAAEMIAREGKHYVMIHDYERMRALFGELLHEIQRIKSEGDYEGARDMVERYGVKIDAALHHEVRERYASLGVAPFSGFVNPRIEAKRDQTGAVVDASISYEERYDDQMLRYSANYR